MLHRAPVENGWQLHSPVGAGDLNFAAHYIANVDDRAAHWIKPVAQDGGSFSVLNGRTGRSAGEPLALVAGNHVESAPFDPGT